MLLFRVVSPPQLLFLALYGENKENNDFDDKVGPISPSSVFSTYTKESFLSESWNQYVLITVVQGNTKNPCVYVCYRNQ